MMGLAGAIRAGKAVVEIFSDTTRLERGLNNAERKLGGFSASAARMGGALIAAGGAAAAPFAASIGAASRLQETMNKFDVVFGSQSAAMKAWGDNYAAQVGRSKEQTASFLAGTQDLLVPMGLEPGSARKMSKDITSLAFDLASFNNLQDADVVRDLQSALTGSGEVMKKYGVILSAAAVNQELMNNAIDPKKATEAQKANARLAIIMKGTTAAQGDAVRSAGSYANQMKRLGATVDNTAASVGGALLPIVTDVVSRFSDAAVMVGNWAANNQGLIVGAAGLAAGLVATGGALLGVAAAAKIAAVGFGLVSTAVSPVALITAGFVGLGVVAANHFGLTEAASQSLCATFGAVKDDALTAFGGIKAALSSGDISGALAIAGALMEVEWIRVTSSLSEIWQGVKDAFMSVTDSMSLKWTEFSNGVLNIWDSVTARVMDKLEKVQGALAVGIAWAVYGEDAANEASAMNQQDTRARDRRRGVGSRMNARAAEERQQRGAAARAAQARADASAAKAAAAQKRLADARARMTGLSGAAQEAAAASAVAEQTGAAPITPAATPTPGAGGRGGSGAGFSSSFAGISGTVSTGVASRLAFSSLAQGTPEKDQNPVPLLGEINENLQKVNDSVQGLPAGGYE